MHVAARRRIDRDARCAQYSIVQQALNAFCTCQDKMKKKNKKRICQTE